MNRAQELYTSFYEKSRGVTANYFRNIDRFTAIFAGMRRPIFCLILLFFASRILMAQVFVPGLDAGWGKGIITLTSGNKLTGEISYNDVEDMIAYRTSARSELKIFHRADVLALSYELSSGVKRNYYSLDLSDRKTNNEDAGFFEMMKEYRDFAVVSKMTFTFQERTVMPPSAGFTKAQKGFLRRSEDIFFLDKNGKLDPYLHIEHGYIDDDFSDPGRKDGKVIDRTLFAKYLESYWPEIERYVNSNRIKLTSRESILYALHLYDELLTQPVFNFPESMLDSTYSEHRDDHKR